MPKTIHTTVYTYDELLKRGNRNAIDNAEQWLADAATDHDWWDYMVDELWKPALAQIGFEDAEIAFSGFGCQGDGASFTSSVDLDKLVDFLTTEIEANECIGFMPDGKTEDFRPWIVKQCNGKPTDTRFRRVLWVRDYIDGIMVKRTSHHYSHERCCELQGGLQDDGELITTTDQGGYLSSEKWWWKSKTPRIRKLVDGFLESAEELRLDLCRAIYRTLEEEYFCLRSGESLKEFADANGYTFTESGKRFG